MKKKISIFILLCSFLLTLTACFTQKSQTELTPDVKKIKNIIELATLKTYYHNVSKLEKEAGTGIEHWFEKDRKMWIEYTGMAKLGIDLSQLDIDIEAQKIMIKMPKAGILNMQVDEKSLRENSYVSSPDGLNKNPITAEEQALMIKEAQEKMRQAILNNQALLHTADERAKELIENYIDQIADLSEKEYEIEWQWIEDLNHSQQNKD